MSNSEIQAETEMIAKLLREQERDGWRVETNIENVPSETGQYALRDGLASKGWGVSWNMRKSIEQSSWFNNMKRPIFMWLPDTDGSAALWLDNKIRCSRCEGKPIIDLFEIDIHNREVHGDLEDLDCCEHCWH